MDQTLHQPDSSWWGWKVGCSLVGVCKAAHIRSLCSQDTEYPYLAPPACLPPRLCPSPLQPFLGPRMAQWLSSLRTGPTASPACGSRISGALPGLLFPSPAQPTLHFALDSVPRSGALIQLPPRPPDRGKARGLRAQGHTQAQPFQWVGRAKGPEALYPDSAPGMTGETRPSPEGTLGHSEHRALRGVLGATGSFRGVATFQSLHPNTDARGGCTGVRSEAGRRQKPR